MSAQLNCFHEIYGIPRSEIAMLHETSDLYRFESSLLDPVRHLTDSRLTGHESSTPIIPKPTIGHGTELVLFTLHPHNPLLKVLY
jgi:hypothetical protein